MQFKVSRMCAQNAVAFPETNVLYRQNAWYTECVNPLSLRTADRERALGKGRVEVKPFPGIGEIGFGN